MRCILTAKLTLTCISFIYSSAVMAQALVINQGKNTVGISTEAQTLNRNDFTQMLSYAMGYSTGLRINASAPKIDINLTYLEKGFQEHYHSKGSVISANKNSPLISAKDLLELMRGYHKKERALIPSGERKYEQHRPENKAKGDAFLQKNKSAPGVLIHPAGFQYKIITKGTGRTPKITDIVHVHYRAYNTDGVEFQSSYQYEQPNIHTPYESDYKGWEQALITMSQGSKWMLYLPSELGFNEGFILPHLLPGAPVIFEIELLKVATNPREVFPE